MTRASGVPAVWQPWQGEVLVPAGTTLLMSATHLGCAPQLEPVPVQWESLDPACVVVDRVEMLVQLTMQIFEQWTGVTPEEAVFQRAVAAGPG